MTTGEYLVLHSTLPSGTALEHLLALQVGSGSGEVIFTSHMTAVVSEDSLAIVERENEAVPMQASEKTAYPKLSISEIFITQRQESVSVEKQAENFVIGRRPSTPKEITNPRGIA